MSDTLKISLLAIVQGLTEFLPVSSSGHLGLGQHLLGFNAPGVIFEVTAHAGTLLAVLIYYRKRIVQLACDMRIKGSDGRHEVLMLIVGVIPIAVVGITCRHSVAQLFDQPQFICAMLIVTGAVLLSFFLVHPRDHRLVVWRALCIGLAQAAAIFPGISRSGATIATAQHLGVEPKRAAEFSLLMMVPAIAGAILISAGDARATGLGNLTVMQMLITLVLSTGVGYYAIVWLVRSLTAGYFKWFGVYCVVAGIVGLILL